MKIRLLVLSIVTFVAVIDLSAQGILKEIWEQGLPNITNYTPQEYRAGIENWNIVQGNNGNIYAANLGGILEYDGTLWRLIKTPQGNNIRSLAKDSKGKIYVGGVNELGYLEPDPNEGMKFHSLLNNLDSSFHEFGDLWHIHVIHDSIYFVGQERILRWANGIFKVWDNKLFSYLRYSWVIHGQLYLETRGPGVEKWSDGLMKLSGDSLIYLSGDEFDQKEIWRISSFGKNHILAIGRNGETYLYDGFHLNPFSNKNEFSHNLHRPFAGIELSNGSFAVSTLGAGLFIFDKEGHVTKKITKKEGLSDDQIYSIYEDASGDVWLGTGNGITRIELNSPLRMINEIHGIEAARDAAIFNNTLYISTLRGLFQSDINPSNRTAPTQLFRKVSGMEAPTLLCNVMGDNFLVANFTGLFSVDRNNSIKKLVDGYIIIGHPMMNSNHLFFGLWQQYISELTKKKDQWEPGNRRIEIKGIPIRIAQVPNGNILIDTRLNGIYEIAWTEKKKDHTLNDNYSLIHYDTTHGLPSPLSLNSLSVLGDAVYVLAGKKGIYKYDQVSKTFRIDSVIMNSIPYKGFQIAGDLQPAYGNGFWAPVSHDGNMRLFKFEDGEGRESDMFFDLPYYKMLDEDKDIAIICSVDKELVLFNKKKETPRQVFFNVSIRKVLLNRDSAIYAGYSIENGSRNFSISYATNDLRFQFSLPSYQRSSKNQYQYFLEGSDEEWSSWSGETQIDFGNLAEGDYIFHVRGKNVYGYISEEDRFMFSILPPWYRTWWAYGFYGLLFTGLVVLIVNVRSRKLQQEKVTLENIVKERTEKITQQTEELTLQTETLTQQAEKLKEMDRIKSDFFANISHEFRTPLTLIKGPIELWLQQPEKNLTVDKAQMIYRNSERLLQLVNQLLDLSRLDSGNLQVDTKDGDVNRFLRIIASSFTSYAEQRNFKYANKVDDMPLFASFDPDKLEKIVSNLLSNAFKFTPDGGTIEFNVSYDKPQLRIEVSDTGEGVNARDLPNIFDRFYRVDNHSTRVQEGTGIGLALVKELTTLLEGEISVYSQPGHGTNFTVILPIIEVQPTSTEVMPESYVAFLHDAPSQNNNETTEIEKETVLIVEDNADMRSFIGEQLAKDFRILTAIDGRQGLEVACGEIPDLIITDIMMPELDGMEFCRQIKSDELTSHIPVIMLTAKGGRESRLDGLETGADDYLTKPFDSRELLIRVNNLIALRKQLRTKYKQEIASRSPGIHVRSIDRKFLEKAERIIEENLPRVEFGVPQLQDKLAMSKTQLHRKMKALTDQAPGEYLRNYRLKRAAQLLEKQDAVITDIAMEVGFGSHSYFTRSFKDHFGQSPSEYIQSKKKII